MKFMSDLVTFAKYSMYDEKLGRRETWEEICDRNMNMHIAKYPKLAVEIKDTFNKYVKTYKVLPSMRSCQFGGKAIDRNNVRIFNCSYSPINSPKAFGEAMFLLLSGTGLGISVQKHHIEKLPKVHPLSIINGRRKRYIVEDSIIGWSEAIRTLIEDHFKGAQAKSYSFVEIRKKGELLKTAGGKAPGAGPLKRAMVNIRKVLRGAYFRKLESVEVLDIMCYIADAVLSGGIRRSAMITLFSAGDKKMLDAKSGEWYTKFGHRTNSNNSVVLDREKTTKEEFYEIWNRVEASGWGEPGFTFTNNKDIGLNPCAEISLTENSFCNLTTVNVSDVYTQDELNNRVNAASFIGTLQAGYTDFHYLRSKWRQNTEEDSLVGVSLTGICSGSILGLDIEEASIKACDTNERYSKVIGINTAKRVTCIKPEGTASLVLGCSSGIHPYWADFYIRRITVNKSESIYPYLLKKLGGTPALEDSVFNKNEAYVVIPVKAPVGAITRYETALEFLERVGRFHHDWITPGHREGDNQNNVSATVTIKEGEWDDVGTWMWENRYKYTGLSVLSHDGGNYPQLPHEEITEVEYNSRLVALEVIDFDITEVKEAKNNVKFEAAVACSGGACELKKL